jgi:hypothetical protein
MNLTRQSREAKSGEHNPGGMSSLTTLPPLLPIAVFLASG